LKLLSIYIGLARRSSIELLTAKLVYALDEI